MARDGQRPARLAAARMPARILPPGRPSRRAQDSAAAAAVQRHRARYRPPRRPAAPAHAGDLNVHPDGARNAAAGPAREGAGCRPPPRPGRRRRTRRRRPAGRAPAAVRGLAGRRPGQLGRIPAMPGWSWQDRAAGRQGSKGRCPRPAPRAGRGQRIAAMPSSLRAVACTGAPDGGLYAHAAGRGPPCRSATRTGGKPDPAIIGPLLMQVGTDYDAGEAGQQPPPPSRTPGVGTAARGLHAPGPAARGRPLSVE